MHSNSSLPFLAIGAAAIGAASAFAQNPLSVPAHADAVEGQQSVGQPFGTPGFRTQILVDGTAIAPNGALLNGIAFRSDRPGTPIAASQIQNVTVELSHSTIPMGSLATTFANNVQTPSTIVFQGTVNLPASGAPNAGPQPWDIVIAFTTPYSFTSGTNNLLIDITANNPGGGFPSHWLDATQGGGSATAFGTSGDHPAFDQLRLNNSTGWDLEPRLVSPGNTLEFNSLVTFSPAPGVVAIGVAAQPVPIDLGPIGAPTNTLYIDPLVLIPHNWTQSFVGWASTFGFALPATPAIVGATLYGQSLVIEPTANALGLVFSNAVECRVGQQFETLPLQQLDTNDPLSATGTLVDFSFTPTPDYGGTPVHFDGFYF